MHHRFQPFNHLFFIFARLGACWTMVLLGVVALLPTAYGADADKAADSAVWQINADRINYLQEPQAYEAEGHVTVVREDRTLTANQVYFDQKNRWASAQGNVRLISGKDILTGDSLKIDLDKEIGTLSKGSVFLWDNHLYLSGEQISKTGPDAYSAKSATVTTCDGPDPDWRITGKDMKVTIEGYGSAKNAAFWAGPVPLLYTPYLVFPVKNKRQSGLLIPDLGWSDRKGVHYLQPWFWAIDESSDATLFADVMSERGLRLGAEYRYVLSPNSLGTLMIEGLNDRQVDDGQDDSSDTWGYADDAYLRPNHDRYWFRAKADQEMPWGMTAKLDLDLVSDQDYLHEFKGGYGGFAKSSDYFTSTFGRDLNDYTDPVRLNQLHLNRTWNQYIFNTDLRWYDNVTERRWAQSHTTVQNLPEISFNGVKQKIASSPLFFNLDSDYVHFYREDGTRGHRTELYPRLYYPTRLTNAFTMEPSVGLRQTAWHIDHFDPSTTSDRNDHYRSIYDLNLNAGTDFYRIFTTSLLGADRLKHAIRPQLEYQHIPDQDQSDYPVFDTQDRIAANNLLSFSLINTLISRSVSPSPADKTPAFRYTSLMRFKVKESFDIDKHNEGDPKPFSNLLAELDITPGRYFALDTDALWSPYDGDFYGYNGAVNLRSARNSRVRAAYRFTRETKSVAGVRSISLEALARLGDHWQLRGLYERNLDTDLLIESGVGISYISQCWALDLDYTVEEDNRGIAIMVHLAGLGNIGN